MSEEPTIRTEHARDLGQAVTATWPERDFPSCSGSRSPTTVVVIKQSVLNSIRTHGLSRTDVEVCGVLVGNGYRDSTGPFVYVEGSIAGAHSDSRLAQVTFTAETWNHIQNELDLKYPDGRILGWYHTHPGFGVFLSGMDLFIHENFFGAPEQLALVYDPLGGDQGLFVWRQGKPIREEFLVEMDEIAFDSAAHQRISLSTKNASVGRRGVPEAVDVPSAQSNTVPGPTRSAGRLWRFLSDWWLEPIVLAVIVAILAFLIQASV